MNFVRLIAISFFLFVFLSTRGFCSDEAADSENITQVGDGQSKNLVSLELISNTPMFESEDYFESGGGSIAVGFKYLPKPGWLLGVSVSNKRFTRKIDDQPLPILTISQESIYILRLYHPTYALIGLKINVILPVQEKILNFKSSFDYSNEVGFGISSAIAHKLTKRFGVSLRCDFWLGVNSTTFRGLEFGIGSFYALW